MLHQLVKIINASHAKWDEKTRGTPPPYTADEESEVGESGGVDSGGGGGKNE